MGPRRTNIAITLRLYREKDMGNDKNEIWGRGNEAENVRRRRGPKGAVCVEELRSNPHEA